MTEPAAGTSSLRRDIVSAYVVTAARVASWVVVSAVVYRRIGPNAFGMLALIRATIGLLNYTSLGLAPAMIHEIAKTPRRVIGADADADADDSSRVLPYASPAMDAPLRRIYASGAAAAAMAAAIGLVVTIAYAAWFARLHGVRSRGGVEAIVLLMGIGAVLRLASDAAGAILQTAGRITRDNVLVATSELAWGAAVLLFAQRSGGLRDVAGMYLLCSALLLVARVIAASVTGGLGMFNVNEIDLGAVRRLFAFGLLVTLAQLADFLYAPADYILINHFFGTPAVAIYAPAVQIDAGLLLLVTALATVLLPRTALAHAANDPQTVRRYYVRGTVASVILLTTAAASVWLLSSWIFQTWLGNPMTQTQLLLPFVLIHTVVGGSSVVGRSILLGIGKVKPFTISVIVAGVANVLLSFIFVRYLHLDVRGIVYATIVVVIARAGLWTPWYVLRTLRRQ